MIADAAAIRLVAVDVDGTLLRPDKSVSDTVRSSIVAASERAHVVIASARPPRSIRAIAALLGLQTPQVCYNGALTWDIATARPIAHKSLDSDRCARAIRLAREHVPHAVVSVEHLDRWYTDRVDLRFVTETGRLFGPDVVAPIETFIHLGATKLMFHAEPTEITELRALLIREMAGQLMTIQTDADLIQAIHPTAGKWQAIQSIAKTAGVADNEILAIGDNENDTEMIKQAGIGVAVANATTAARDAADWIAPANVDDGVAAALERFVLGDVPYSTPLRTR